MTAPLYPKDAKALAAVPTTLTDEQLAECWRVIAGQISYLNADDCGSDWKDVPLWRPALDAFDAEHDRRGLPRPSRAGFLL
jgi:hypothetical protein